MAVHRPIHLRRYHPMKTLKSSTSIWVDYDVPAFARQHVLDLPGSNRWMLEQVMVGLLARMQLMLYPSIVLM